MTHGFSLWWPGALRRREAQRASPSTSSARLPPDSGVAPPLCSEGTAPFTVLWSTAGHPWQQRILVSLCGDDASFVDSTHQCRFYVLLLLQLEGTDVLGVCRKSHALFDPCRVESTLRQSFGTPVRFGLNDRAHDTSGGTDVVYCPSPEDWAADLVSPLVLRQLDREPPRSLHADIA